MKCCPRLIYIMKQFIALAGFISKVSSLEAPCTDNDISQMIALNTTIDSLVVAMTNTTDTLRQRLEEAVSAECNNCMYEVVNMEEMESLECVSACAAGDEEACNECEGVIADMLEQECTNMTTTTTESPTTTKIEV